MRFIALHANDQNHDLREELPDAISPGSVKAGVQVRSVDGLRILEVPLQGRGTDAEAVRVSQATVVLERVATAMAGSTVMNVVQPAVPAGCGHHRNASQARRGAAIIPRLVSEEGDLCRTNWCLTQVLNPVFRFSTIETEAEMVAYNLIVGLRAQSVSRACRPINPSSESLRNADSEVVCQEASHME